MELKAACPGVSKKVIMSEDSVAEEDEGGAADSPLPDGTSSSSSGLKGSVCPPPARLLFNETSKAPMCCRCRIGEIHTSRCRNKQERYGGHEEKGG
jgi:hypothetical protein